MNEIDLPEKEIEPEGIDYRALLKAAAKRSQGLELVILKSNQDKIAMQHWCRVVTER